jgi:exosome complex component RRP40
MANQQRSDRVDDRERENESDDKNVVVAVIPGDDVTSHIQSKIQSVSDQLAESKVQVKLGPGLRRATNSLDSHSYVASVTGGLVMKVKSSTKNGTTLTAWVQSSSHATPTSKNTFMNEGSVRYLYPSLHDRVIGIVQDRLGSDGSTGGDLFRIHIGSCTWAILSNLSFDGASKRNKPALKPGQVLYARIQQVDTVTQTVWLSCATSATSATSTTSPMDAHLPHRDWMTNESAYGILHGGTVTRVTPAYAHQLLETRDNNDHVLWQALATTPLPPRLAANAGRSTFLAYEVAIGMNGYIWVHSSHPNHTVLIVNAIHNAAVLGDDAKIRAMIPAMFQSLLLLQQQQQKQLPVS